MPTVAPTKRPPPLIKTMRRQMREFMELCRRAPESTVQAQIGDPVAIATSLVSMFIVLTTLPMLGGAVGAKLSERHA
jgi:hypothetical protein